MQTKRLQLVVGKGGVGKSTVVAAIALAEAHRGRRVLAVELGQPGGLARIFGVRPRAPGELVEVRTSLAYTFVDGESALAEYLELVVPIRRLLATVFASRIYRFFVAAAPGLKELMTIGKIWYESQRTDGSGRPLWDTIVVDAGASGHSLQYLQMPTTAAETFASGLVHREAKRVEALLKDPALTAVHIVALPEEMPVTEALQIVQRLRGDLSMPLGELLMNRCRSASPAGASELLERMYASEPCGDDEVAGFAAREVWGAIRTAAERALSWEQVQVRSIDRLEKQSGQPVHRLPLLFAEEFGLREVERLAALLETEALA